MHIPIVFYIYIFIFISIIVFFNRFTHLKAIICPWAEFHKTGLLVEGKVSNIYFAGRFKNCGRCPKNFAGVMQNSLSHCCHTVFSVRAESRFVISSWKAYKFFHVKIYYIISEWVKKSINVSSLFRIDKLINFYIG